MPILRRVQTPEPFPPAEQEPFFEPEDEAFPRPAATGFWALGGRLAWIAGLVPTISAFTDWQAGPDTARPTLAVLARPAPRRAAPGRDREAPGHARQARLRDRPRADRAGRRP